MVFSEAGNDSADSGFVVYLEDRKRGTIVLEDHRQRGAVVLLACKPLGGGGSGAVLPTPLPSPDDDYIIFGDSIEELGGMEFKLTIDLNDMPAGALEFDLNTFIAKAREVASFTDRVRLDQDTAADWGFRVDRPEERSVY